MDAKRERRRIHGVQRNAFGAQRLGKHSRAAQHDRSGLAINDQRAGAGGLQRGQAASASSQGSPPSRLTFARPSVSSTSNAGSRVCISRAASSSAPARGVRPPVGTSRSASSMLAI